MSRLSDFSIPDSSTLLQAVEKIQKNQSRTVMVVRDDIVVGVVSEGDVMRALLRGVSVHTPLSEFAPRSFKYLRSSSEREAFEIFRKHAVSMVPVVDDNFRLVDVITLEHLIRRLELP